MPQSVHHLIDTYTVAHLVEHADRVCFVRCSHKGVHRADLHFFRGDVEIPPSRVEADGRLTLNFAERHVSAVLATLRYEKPLAAWLNPETGLGGVSTSGEPMGEQEGR